MAESRKLDASARYPAASLHIADKSCSALDNAFVRPVSMRRIVSTVLRSLLWVALAQARAANATMRAAIAVVMRGQCHGHSIFLLIASHGAAASPSRISN